MTFPLLFIVGPTASGKTRLSIELSTRLRGEIVLMDSMQIYKSLDIGTGKPTREEQLQARHHLIDIKNPDETYSAAQWANDARTAIAEIRSRGNTPIVVGGTGFYARALLHPESLASAPPNEELRVHLQWELEKHGAQALHEQLRVLDANAAERLPASDARRVIRAIEVATFDKSTSRELELETRSPVEADFQPLILGIEWRREELYRRIEARIDAMLRDGFMNELQRLTQMNLGESATALQSLGYKQMCPALEDASRFDECLELWKRDTRRYAKRQMTWFRHQLPTQWLNVSDDTNWTKTADKIAIEYSMACEKAARF